MCDEDDVVKFEAHSDRVIFMLTMLRVSCCISRRSKTVTAI